MGVQSLILRSLTLLVLGIFAVACSGGNATKPVVPEIFQPNSLDPTLIEVANSVQDFSNTQGQGSWHYGYFEECPMGSAGNCVDEFQELSFDEDLNWWMTSVHGEPGYTSTVLKSDAAHPNSPSAANNQAQIYQSAVRRWISPYQGKLVLRGEVSPSSENFAMGDGTVAYINVDGEREFKFNLHPDDTEGVDYEIEVQVEDGSVIDFVLEGNENSFFDTTIFTSLIFRVEAN